MRPLKYLRSQIDRLLQQRIVRDTLWLLVGKGMRLVLQAAYFVIIARTLGVANYGAFVGTTALVGIVSPFVGVGIETLLLKNVAKDRSLVQEYWGNALWMVLVTGIGLMIALVLASPVALPAISPLLNLSGRAFQAVDRLDMSAQINISVMFMKVLAAFSLMYFFATPNPLDWAWLYLASSIVSALSAAWLVHRLLGAPKLALNRILPELKEGFYFSISTSAYTVYNDIDKTMLARLSTLEATGIYAAAYRLIDVAFIPVISIAGAAYADFFRKGKDGIAATVAFARPY
jgi:O-antigen/teichoic acid export membrane protein